MYLKAAIIASFIPSLLVAAEECADNERFTFPLDSNGHIKTCQWLTKNKNNAVSRKAKYCTRGPIRGACPISCDSCPCLDDPEYTFLLKWQSTYHHCDYIVAKNRRKRQKKLCFEEDASVVSEIGHTCPMSCDFCTGGSGSNAPSNNPSATPSYAPTGDPTASPSVAPTISVQPSSSPSSHPSVSAQPTPVNPVASPSAIPSVSMNPTPLHSSKPSISAKPTISGSARPSSSPSIAPTELPSKPPTMAPIVGCFDDPGFEFVLNNNKTVECDWLLKRNSDARVSKYCTRGHVKTGCSASCRYCTCEDDPEFTFQTKYGNTTKHCDWIQKKNTLNRQHNNCFEGDYLSASKIGSACVRSCGYCTNQRKTRIDV